MYRRFGRSKFGNKKTEVDGLIFSSMAEARRYQELKMMMASKLPSQRVVLIECQPEFILIPRWIEVTGERIAWTGKNQFKQKTHRATKYIADFKVTYADGRIEFEDVKGFKTKTYKLKLAMLRYQKKDERDFIFKEIS